MNRYAYAGGPGSAGSVILMARVTPRPQMGYVSARCLRHVRTSQVPHDRPLRESASLPGTVEAQVCEDAIIGDPNGHPQPRAVHIPRQVDAVETEPRR